MRMLEDAQKSAVKKEVLPDGRIRYYNKERLCNKLGPTRGNTYVTEYNPKTGNVKSWTENRDRNDKVLMVHPKALNGQVLKGQHYPPTGKEKAAWGLK